MWMSKHRRSIVLATAGAAVLALLASLDHPALPDAPPIEERMEPRPPRDPAAHAAESRPRPPRRLDEKRKADEAKPDDPRTLLEGNVALGDVVGAEEVERQAIARERFSKAVADGDFTSEQIDPSVVEIFRGMELVPVLDDAGMILGLEIVDVEKGSAARRAGFARGDRIDEIDGQRLRDPADVPALLVQLGPRPRICAMRGQRRVCRSVGATG